MGAQSRSAKAGDAARSVASNPYVRRLLEDEELRDNIRVAFEAAKDAYARMSNGKGPAKALMDDKKVHRDLQHRGRVASRTPPTSFAASAAAAGFGLGKALLVGHRRRRPGADPQRGRPQGRAGQAVRRRGGVRVHLDHHPGSRRPSRPPRGRQQIRFERAPSGAPSFLSKPLTRGRPG